MPDPIQHVIFLLMENHSFDQMLGCFPGVDGIDPTNPRFNRGKSGKQYFQQPNKESQTRYDPKHEHVDVEAQLANNNGGFVQDYENAYGSKLTDDDRQQIMDYYPMGFLPALHALASDFTICDRWYSSVPGPTWTNRFFALSGTSMGRVIMPEGLHHITEVFHQTQHTIFDRLREAGRSSKVYFYDFPSSWLLLRQLLPENAVHYRPIHEFFKDVRHAASFPDFVFIEPKYFLRDQNDDHPPHNIFKAEKLIADVYNAIRSNPDLWATSLLVVLFDEHGGFYDHVVPPGAVRPDDHTEEYTFDRLGVRVPALLVSPWAGKRVEHTQFDHTSLLKYLTDKWDLGPLGARTEAATSIIGALNESVPRTETIPFIRVPFTDLIPPHPEWEIENVSKHHDSIRVFSRALELKVSGFEKPIWPPPILSRIGASIARILTNAAGVFLRGQEKATKDWTDRTSQLVNHISRDGLRLPEVERTEPPQPVA